MSKGIGMRRRRTRRNIWLPAAWSILHGSSTSAERVDIKKGVPRCSMQHSELLVRVHPWSIHPHLQIIISLWTIAQCIQAYFLFAYIVVPLSLISFPSFHPILLAASKFRSKRHPFVIIIFFRFFISPSRLSTLTVMYVCHGERSEHARPVCREVWKYGNVFSVRNGGGGKWNTNYPQPYLTLPYSCTLPTLPNSIQFHSLFSHLCTLLFILLCFAFLAGKIRVFLFSLYSYMLTFVGHGIVILCACACHFSSSLGDSYASCSYSGWCNKICTSGY